MSFLHNKTNALRSQQVRDRVDLPGFSREALSDLSGVNTVVHQKKFKVFLVSDEELLEARLEHVSGLSVLLATNSGFQQSASESSSHTTVDTSCLSPRALKCKRDVSK